MAAPQHTPGAAMTVTGPVDPQSLGVTLMHEHLFLGGGSRGPGPGTPATQVALWEQPLTLEHLHLAREGVRFKGLMLGDEALAVREAQAFRAAGGQTFVDTTNIGMGRDPLALRRVATVTGLNIVMGCGWYTPVSHPRDMDARTPEDLAQEMVRDMTAGVGETGVRSGIIGELGINGDPLTPNELKVVTSAAWASKATGAAISLHYGGLWRERLQVAELLAREGADLSRVIFGHSDSYAADLPFLQELLATGVCVEFDLLGRPGAPIARRPGVPGVNPWGPQATDILVAEAVPKLIEAGYGDRILLSQDVGFTIWLRSYGGNGYAFVLEKVLQELRRQGVTEAQLHTIMVDTPRRLLTLGGTTGNGEAASQRPAGVQ